MNLPAIEGDRLRLRPLEPGGSRPARGDRAGAGGERVVEPAGHARGGSRRSEQRRRGVRHRGRGHASGLARVQRRHRPRLAGARVGHLPGTAPPGAWARPRGAADADPLVCGGAGPEALHHRPGRAQRAGDSRLHNCRLPARGRDAAGRARRRRQLARQPADGPPGQSSSSDEGGLAPAAPERVRAEPGSEGQQAEREGQRQHPDGTPAVPTSRSPASSTASSKSRRPEPDRPSRSPATPSRSRSWC